MPPEAQSELTSKMERALHGVLLVGTVLSIALFLIGTCLAIARSEISGVENTIPLESMIDSMASLSGIGFMVAGIMVLVATPLIRIIATMIYFGGRDRLLSLIAFATLALIVLSFLIRMM